LDLDPLQELGLVFFLASAGVRGGGALVATLQEHGIMLFGLGVCVSVMPLIVAWPIPPTAFSWVAVFLNPPQQSFLADASSGTRWEKNQ
jgi:hypothetical protein